jgi:hypothetical protein
VSTAALEFPAGLFHDSRGERRHRLSRHCYEQLTPPLQFDFKRSWLNFDASFPGPNVKGYSWFDASFPSNLDRYDKPSGRIHGSFHGIDRTIGATRQETHSLKNSMSQEKL